MTVFAYTRVSTVVQEKDGLSLDDQKRQIDGYAQMLNVAVDAVFVERGVSGTIPLAQRPQGSRLLETIKDGDTIISSKLDRMFRSASDALNTCNQLKKRKIKLHLIDLGGDVNDNGISKLVFSILSAVAEAETARISERVSDVKKYMRLQGRHQGGEIPFGFALLQGQDKKNYLVEVPEQQDAIQMIRELRSGGLSYRKISSEIERSSGIKISYEGVRRIVKNIGTKTEIIAKKTKRDEARD